MKKPFIFFTLLITLCAGGRVYAQFNGFGAGIIIGAPTGLSGKLWLSSKNAVDMGLGYSLGRRSALYIHADYLFHIQNVFNSTEKLPVHYGIGLKLESRDGEAGLGVRGVIGLNWIPRDVPAEIFFELAPVFHLFPSTSLGLDGGVGARYYFN